MGAASAKGLKLKELPDVPKTSPENDRARSGSGKMGGRLSRRTLTVQEKLIQAIDNKDMDVINELVKSGVSLNQRHKDYTTPLHQAVLTGDIDIVQFLLCKGAMVNGCEIPVTPLHLACRLGHFDICDALVKFGAMKNVKDDANCTPLWVAVANDHPDVTFYLLSGDCQIDVPCGDGVSIDDKESTALVRSVKNKNAHIAAMLVSRGANVNYQDAYGRTPLHHAALQGDLTICRMLLAQRTTDINAIDSEGVTPFFASCEGGHSSVAQELLDAGCDIAKPKTDNGNNSPDAGFLPIHIAVAKNQEEIVEMLCQNEDMCNIVESHSKTPLLLACELGMFDMADLLMDYDFCDVNFKDESGDTPLIKATCKNQLEVVNLLLSNEKCEVDMAGSAMRTALHYAAEKGNLEMVDLLLEGGARFDIEDKYGYTPLLYSIISVDLGLVHTFLRHGCPVQSINCENITLVKMVLPKDVPTLLNFLLLVGWRPDKHYNEVLKCLDKTVVENDVYDNIEYALRQPRTLAQWCRVVAMDRLTMVTGNTSVMESLDDVPLPVHLVHFLAYSDVENMCGLEWDYEAIQ